MQKPLANRALGAALVNGFVPSPTPYRGHFEAGIPALRLRAPRGLCSRPARLGLYAAAPEVRDGQLVLLETDLHVHAGSQIQFHQRVHRLLGGLYNIEYALVSADLELITSVFVHVR